MEMLLLLCLAASVLIVWRKPEWEKLAFGLYLAATSIVVVMFLIAVSAFFVPMGAI